MNCDHTSRPNKISFDLENIYEVYVQFFIIKFHLWFKAYQYNTFW